MKGRREFLLASLAGPLLPAASAASSHPKVLARQSLAAPFDGQQATFVEVTYPPGAASSPHKHPGFVLGYVLEGKLRFQVDDGPVQELGAGETFYEHPGAVHSISSNALADRTTRILAIQIAESGSAIVQPV